MLNVSSAIRDTVSITDLNRGLAGKIFEDVKKTGAKVVMKNNVAECVLLSPEEYVRIMDELEDAKLYALAMERMSRDNPPRTISQEEMDAHFGVTEDDLSGWEDMELE